jgi:hypothetical protein
MPLTVRTDNPRLVITTMLSHSLWYVVVSWQIRADYGAWDVRTDTRPSALSPDMAARLALENIQAQTVNVELRAVRVVDHTE